MWTRHDTFTTRIAPHVKRELMLARQARHAGLFEREFAHLEAAHVLGQSSTSWHVHVHLEMARWAWRRFDAREFIGQVIRIIGAATKTALGLVPRGNTGGARISPFASLPLSPEHAALIAEARRAR